MTGTTALKVLRAVCLHLCVEKACGVLGHWSSITFMGLPALVLTSALCAATALQSADESDSSDRRPETALNIIETASCRTLDPNDELSGMLTAVLQAVEEGAVHARIEGAIAHERGRQLLGVPRHHHTLRAPHLRHSSCVRCYCCPEKQLPMHNMRSHDMLLILPAEVRPPSPVQA